MLAHTAFNGLKRSAAAALGTLALAAAGPAVAGPITTDTFWQFSFGGAGSTAAGCAPADPAGDFCLASSGTPTSFLDAPAWTFLAPPTGATLTVIDAFLAGEVFQVFDFGVLLGSTSAPVDGVDCGDDPVVCLAMAGMSWGSFALAAGAHSLTLVATASPGGLGSAYLQLTAASGVGGTVPEPASLLLTLAALAALRPAKPASRTRRA